jgi:hypothetical protein
VSSCLEFFPYTTTISTRRNIDSNLNLEVPFTPHRSTKANSRMICYILTGAKFVLYHGADRWSTSWRSTACWGIVVIPLQTTRRTTRNQGINESSATSRSNCAGKGSTTIATHYPGDSSHKVLHMGWIAEDREEKGVSRDLGFVVPNELVLTATPSRFSCW